MRWRLRFWFNKRDTDGRCLEDAPIDRDHHPVDEERYIYLHREDEAIKRGQAIAKPGDTFELRLAPECVKCKKEMLDWTEKDLQKAGWGGNGDEMACVSCGGLKGTPEKQRMKGYPVIDVPDDTVPTKKRLWRRENGVRLIEQLKQRVLMLQKRLERVTSATVPRTRTAGEPRTHYLSIKQVDTESNLGVSEYTLEQSRGITLKKDDEE